MEVKIVKVTKVDNEKVKAAATIVVGDAIMIHGVKLIKGENGHFLSMPSRKDKNGKYVDVVHPVTAEMREKIVEAMLNSMKEEGIELE